MAATVCARCHQDIADDDFSSLKTFAEATGAGADGLIAMMVSVVLL